MKGFLNMACQFNNDRAISPQYPVLTVTQDGSNLCVEVNMNDPGVSNFSKSYNISDSNLDIASDLVSEIQSRLSSGSLNMYKRSILISQLIQNSLSG